MDVKVDDARKVAWVMSGSHSVASFSFENWGGRGPAIAAARKHIEGPDIAEVVTRHLDEIYVRDGFCDWADVANARDAILRELDCR